MHQDYEFWVLSSEYNIRLPIPPASFEVTYQNQMEVVRATEFGDINIPTTTSPQAIVLEGIFSTNEYTFAHSHTTNIYKTIDYVRLFEEIIENKEVVRLIVVSSSTTAINRKFYVESIKYYEDYTTNSDIEYSISLREYKPLNAIKTIYDDTTTSSSREVETTPYTPKTHTVVSGDNLWNIARKYYGTNDWQTIYNANISIIGSNANLIRPGQVLTIPEV